MLTPDLGGTATTKQVTDAVIDAIHGSNVLRERPTSAAKVPPRGGTTIAAAASGGVRCRGTMMDWPGVSVAFSGSELLCASDHSGTRLAAAMLSMVSPRRTGMRTPLSHNSTSVSAGTR